MRQLFFLFILSILNSVSLFSQKTILKNGIKINRLDKQNKKQDRWFFFDKEGNTILSCDYKNDSVISPLTFYIDNDTAFIRFPKTNDSELFILYLDKQKVIGNYSKSVDTILIEIAGSYHQISKDSFQIKEDTSLLSSKIVLDTIRKWFGKKIPPLYMFGNSLLKDFLYGGFHGSDFIFNKAVYAEISINESGIVESVEFPRDKNNLSFTEEAEIAHIFSGMPRWQPYFSEGKTKKYKLSYIWSTTLEKIGSPN
jgi:hypothetical protein